MLLDSIAEKLQSLAGVELERPDVALTGVHLDVLVDAATLREATQLVRDAEFMVESTSGLDATPHMMVVHHFAHPDQFCRVALRVLVDRDEPTCPTIYDIYPGADWHERETHDFYGIKFIDHPDMSPLILCEDDGDLNPLLKKEKKLKALGDVLPRFAEPEPEPEPEEETPEVDA